MLRKSLFLILSSCLYGPLSSAQQLPANLYGNEVWLTDSIVGLPAPESFGFQYRPAGSIQKGPQLNLPKTPGDSNTYSRLIYRLSTAQNQTLAAHIDRPLSRDEALTIHLQRLSNAGWMVSSQTQLTNAHFGITKNLLKDRIRIEADGSADIFDREQNGGLKGRDYSLPDDAGSFGLLANDVELNSAFNRSTAFRGRIKTLYKQSARLHVGIIAEMGLEQFLFGDQSGDKDYYEPFRTDTANTDVRDSNRVFNWAVGAVARYRLGKDSASKRWLEGQVVQRSIRFNSVGPSDFTSNMEVSVGYRHEHRANQLRLLLRSVLTGYNQGDVHATFNWTRKSSMDSLDTSARTNGFALRLNAQQSRPALIYTHYSSNFFDLVNDLNKVNSFDLDLSVVSSNEHAGAGASVFGQARQGFVYLDPSLEVQQAQDMLAIAGTELFARFANKGLSLSAKARYQINLTDRVYDLPMFVSIVDASFEFPMFNKSIYLRAGADGWYFSEYLARGYIPMNDLYFVQTTERFGNYVQVNPYLKATVQSVDVKIRLLNATYGLINSKALVGPGYPGIPRFVEFQVDWTFKN